MDEILPDGSIKGKTFSGSEYKGEQISSRHGEETYQEFYNRVCEAKKVGYHLGDLCWGDWHNYCHGSPAGGGQYIQHIIIGEETDDDLVDDNIEEEEEEEY